MGRLFHLSARDANRAGPGQNYRMRKSRAAFGQTTLPPTRAIVE
jgi:hypothetical protein